MSTQWIPEAAPFQLASSLFELSQAGDILAVTPTYPTATINLWRPVAHLVSGSDLLGWWEAGQVRLLSPAHEPAMRTFLGRFANHGPANPPRCGRKAALTLVR